jgi:hypothetical protein
MTEQPGDLGSVHGGGKRIFSSDLCVQTSSETHPASCPMGNKGPLPGAKERLGRDAKQEPSSPSAEVMNE